MTSCSSQRRPNPAGQPIHDLFPQQYQTVFQTELEAAHTRSGPSPNLPDCTYPVEDLRSADGGRGVLIVRRLLKTPLRLNWGEGARCVLGGKPASGPGLEAGQFIEPTIFADVTNQMRIAQDEVFGPVLSIIGFDDEEQAVQIANDVIFGLAAGVWTKDISRAIRISKALRAGTVYVNTYRAVSYMMPFGGMKRSGLGRESGIEAIREYLETKSVWISTAQSAPENPFIMR
jgi:hypothetical protein